MYIKLMLFYAKPLEADAKEQFFLHAIKDTRAAANRMAATDRVRYKTSQYHDHRCHHVGRTGLLRLPPEGCCFAQEAFTYAICLSSGLIGPGYAGTCNAFGCSPIQTLGGGE